MQVVAYVPRSGLAFVGRVFSATQLRHQNWSSVTSQWHRNSDSSALKIFQNGTSFLPFHELIFGHKFYSTNASATVQISEKTQSASDKEESPESQALNSKKQADRLPNSNKSNKPNKPNKLNKPLPNWTMMGLKRAICKVLQKGGNDMEETLTKLGFWLNPQIVIMVLVLDRTVSPILARRFFQWATLQPGFKHNISTYDALTRNIARSKDFNTLQMVFSERLGAHVDVSVRTFRFAIDWDDDPNLLNEVIRIIEKMPFSTRKRSYNLLIRALCPKNVNAALSVLEKMVIADCAPESITFRPFIKFYRRHKQMDNLQEIYETMKIFRCPLVFE